MVWSNTFIGSKGPRLSAGSFGFAGMIDRDVRQLTPTSLPGCKRLPISFPECKGSVASESV